MSSCPDLSAERQDAGAARGPLVGRQDSGAVVRAARCVCQLAMAAQAQPDEGGLAPPKHATAEAAEARFAALPLCRAAFSVFPLACAGGEVD